MYSFVLKKVDILGHFQSSFLQMCGGIEARSSCASWERSTSKSKTFDMVNQINMTACRWLMYARTCVCFLNIKAKLVLFQTISALIRGVFKRPSSEYGFDVIDVLIGFNDAEATMQV